ncbi:MAG TPA: GNAT family N-acetyltransferase [Sphingomicrobium sp.]|nr:GNAT family N-acetyltransferase [Sphingomicrobium sp.]
MNEEPAATPPFYIKPARTQREFAVARGLFAAYATSLPVDLAYQDFNTEIAALPGKYAPPMGELLLAWDAIDRPVACIGLRPFNEDKTCEMKRLYVAPEARSFGLGKALTEAVIQAAKDKNYSFLRLDTLPNMITAAALYQRMGFRRIAAYYGPTPAGTIFMELDLTR